MIRMADLCARSEQCEADIRTKLFRMKLPAHEIDRILDQLREENFINEERFAGSFARDKVRFSAWGKNKIRLGLFQKRISGEAISQALDSIPRKDYIDALLRVASAKSRSLDLSDYEDRAKLYRHILSRGFESQLASKAVARMKRLQEEEE